VQLVDLVPELAHELDALDTHFDLPQLQNVITSAIVGLGRRIWLFIDALDECREGDVLELIAFLDGLQTSELYVCFASRHYPIAKVPTNLQLVLEEVDEHKQDLSTYIEKLDLEGDELAQMQLEIAAKANGIFLWVVLVVDILQKDVERARFHAMRSRLREIPEGLPALFKTIILRDNEYKDEFLLCLRWILYAVRPLALKEWYFAMMAGVAGSLEWGEGVTKRRMETFLLSSSKGLAEVTKDKTMTAQFIHESVRDFLIYQGGFEEICGNRESLGSTAHQQLKHCCLRGMEVELPRQLEQRKDKKQLLTEEERSSLKAKYPFAEYATTHILHHADQAAIGFCQQHFLADEFTRSGWSNLFNAFQKNKPNVYSDAPGLTYLCAEKNLARLLPRPAEALSFCVQQRYGSPIVSAIVNSSWEVLSIFLDDMNVPNVDETFAEIESKAKFVLLPRQLLQFPWRWAVRNGLAHLSKHLLTYVSEKELNSDGNVLAEPSLRGDEKVVKLLIDAGADVDAQGGQYSNALQGSSSQGHEKVVEMLPVGTDLIAPGGYHGNALQWASLQGHEKVVRVLLDAGAIVDTQGGQYNNALQGASSRGYEKVVQMLVEAGAGVNVQRGQIGNALQRASSQGHEKVVQILLDAGADVNAQRRYYGSALHWASLQGHEKVVKMLLDAGADMNAHGGRYMSALSCGHHNKIVEMLQDIGADVKARRGCYGEALQWASSQGHEKVVQILLDAGADISSQRGYYGGALYWASLQGHKKVVQMLLAAGADVSVQGGQYGSALRAASHGGHEEVVQMLRAAGAR
jgi:ankyrin repeat protein